MEPIRYPGMDYLTSECEWTHEPLEKARAKAIELAEHILDTADDGHIDRDGDLCVLARQLLIALGLI